jgi:hypothetical protein
VIAQDSKAEIFDVFLCHNSEDKSAVREIAQRLSEENIKAWLDEADIRSGSFWHAAIGQQIETVKSAAVCVGQHGVGPWQHREIIALLDQFDRRGCPVIPVILASAPEKPVLPWSLAGLHCVDFRATDSHPLKRLIWGITGQKPAELSDVPFSEKPATMRDAAEFSFLPNREDGGVAHKAPFGGLEISKRRLYPPLSESPNADQAAHLEILRRRVKEYWVDGVLKHSLDDEVLISLGKRQIDEAVDAPWKYTVEVSDAVSSEPLEDRDVGAIYDATGLLLILGEPGSGKTTTLLHLAEILLERARTNIKERVPVVLNLSTWKKQQPLRDWIVVELLLKYRVPAKMAPFWLLNNYLVLLLDGLDEVETSLQPECVAAINAFMDEFNPSGMVVCCRLNEYRWLPRRLKLNGAIRLEPLSEHEVAEYLAKGGSKLAALREAMTTDPVLQELAQTPLMLSIMSLASQGVGGDELSGQKGDSLEERRKKIFGLYIEQMFRRKGPTSFTFSKEKSFGWLSWLAGKMRERSQSVFLVEELQPGWLRLRSELGTYKTVVALSAPLFFGLIFGLTGGLIFGPTYGLGIELIGGLIFGGVVGWLVGGMGGLIKSEEESEDPQDSEDPLEHISLVETVSWNWIPFWKGTIGKSISVAFFLLFFALWDWLTGKPIGWEAVIGSLIVGLIVGLIGGVLDGIAGSLKEAKASPNQGINLSLQNSLAVLLVTFPIFALIFGVIFGLFVALQGEPRGLLIVALVGGLIVALIVALIIALHRGGSAVIKHYALRLVLWLKGDTPFKFVRFLDQCAKLVFLKKVGGGYIFIHRMLLEYFANLELHRHAQRYKKRFLRKKTCPRFVAGLVLLIALPMILFRRILASLGGFTMHQVSFSPKSALELVKDLKDPLSKVRSSAAEALGQMGRAGAKFAPEVAALLKEPDFAVRWRAAEALGQMGQAGGRVVCEVARLLRDPDFTVRLNAATALGQIGQARPALAPEVAALLRDPDSDIRWGAATALGQMGEAGAKFRPELAALLTDPDYDVRRSAATALKQMGNYLCFEDD